MNGEMLQAAMDVIAVEYYRRTDQISERLLPGAGQNPPHRKFLFLSGRETEDYAEWIKWVNDDKICKIIFYPDIQKLMDHRKELGIVGNFTVIMVVFHNDHEITYWENKWQFDEQEKCWCITTEEHAWKDGPWELIDFPAGTETRALYGSLQEAIKLCGRIGADSYQQIFKLSLQILDQGYAPVIGQLPYFERYAGIIPKQNIGLLAASANAFSFVMLCSWNDEPEKKAQAAGLREEFDQMIKNLVYAAVSNLTYAVNQWETAQKQNLMKNF